MTAVAHVLKLGTRRRLVFPMFFITRRPIVKITVSLIA